MIEGIASLRHHGETQGKKCGDIIAVKLSGSSWSDRERTGFLLVDIEDDALEAKLNAMFTSGDPMPCISYPYESETSRCTRVIDVDAMPIDLKSSVLDQTVETGKLLSDQYTTVNDNSDRT